MKIDDSWYPVDEFPNSQYEINMRGQVRNCKTNKLLAGHTSSGGYLAYTLTVEGKVYTRFAHLMVAKQFIPNPNGYPIVNHKDENKNNPSIENLEWTTYSNNAAYGSAQERSEGKRSKPINEYSLDGRYIRTWKSAKHIYLFFGLPYDGNKRTTYLVKILSNNDNPDSEKIVFANRIFMRYCGSVDDEEFEIKQTGNLRNDTYRMLTEPCDVPDEYVIDVSIRNSEAEELLALMQRKYKSIFSAKEFSALTYAIKCVKKIHDYEYEEEYL